MMLLHFPVTPRWWRGVWDLAKVGWRSGALRRACDWHKVAPTEVSYSWPTCRFCCVYRDRIRVMCPTCHLHG